MFAASRRERIVGSAHWRKVVYVLNRGGRFEDHGDAYDGARVGHPYGKLLNLCQEKTAKTVHAGTGEKNPGYDLTLITHRVIEQTESRTIADPWLSGLLPENGVLINPIDLGRLGLEDGQDVRVISATNTRGEWDLGAGNAKPMVGKVVATQTIRPGVVSFALGFGHWATGAGDITIDGIVVRGEERRRAGIHANAAMWTDPIVINTCLSDPVGGSVSFYDTKVRLERVGGRPPTPGRTRRPSPPSWSSPAWRRTRPHDRPHRSPAGSPGLQGSRPRTPCAPPGPSTPFPRAAPA